jgi:mannosyltransferase OCH1-like enzyme
VPTGRKNPLNRTRLLEEEVQEVRLDYTNPCLRVDAFNTNPEGSKMCLDFEALPHINPDCSSQSETVPKILHSVNRDGSQLHHQIATTLTNPDFVRNHHSDKTAYNYIFEKCGEEMANAYSCLVPPAFRADLFRYCALYVDGGVYIDNDIFPLFPLEELYSSCSMATIGYDLPRFDKPKKQMKIMAGTPGAPIFKCAMNQILNNMRFQIYPEDVFDISGPGVLQKCYEENSENIAITYHDTRNSLWPWTGMRAGNKILAVELPIQKKHFLAQSGYSDPDDYYPLFLQRKVYEADCFKY